MSFACQEQKEKLGRISVVIPTLNAARALPPLLEALAGAGVGEVILADGGSADGTARLGRVVAAPRGRGAQLAA
ncbi:MAG: glycosyl transferase family 2, partial [Rubritepida sp.]|nr:glycosyl transferase family 2 [Rubritepida sp.]